MRQDPELAPRLALPDARLVLLEAPPGFGKRALLEAWARRLADAGVDIALLRATHEMRRSDSFSGALATAITGAAMATRDLVRLLQARRRRLVILIDGFDQAGAAGPPQLLAYLCRHMSDRVQLVIASDQPVPHLAALGFAAVRLGADDLAVAPPALTRLFPGLSPSQRDAIAAWSESWPLAIEFAQRHSARGGDPAELVETCPADGDSLFADIRARLLDPLPRLARRLLVETSFLTELDADLVEAVTGIPGAWRVLEDLERRGLLRPFADAGVRRHRCMKLLRRVLQAELARRGRNEIARLQRAAARSLHANGRLHEAVRHARESGDGDFLASVIIEAGGIFLGARSGAAALRALLQFIPPETMRRHPRLAVAEAYVLISDGRPALARDMIVAVRRRLSRGTTQDEWLLQDLHFAEVTLAGSSVLRTSEAKLDHLETSPAGSFGEALLMRGIRNNLAGWVHFRTGDFAAARTCAETAIHCYSSTDAPNGVGHAHLLLGLVQMETGEIDDAMRLYDAARVIFAQDCPDDPEARAVADILMAEALYEQGRLHEARRLCGPALAQVPFAYFDPLAVGYRTLAALTVAESGWQAGAEILASGVGLATQRGFAELEAILQLCVAELQLDQRPTRMRSLAALGEPAVPTDPGCWRSQDRRELLAARLALHDGDPRGAISQLQVQIPRYEDAHRPRSAVAARLLLALAHEQSGAREAAAEQVERAIAACLKRRVVAPFLEHARALTPLLMSIRSKACGDDVAAFINRVLAIASASNAGNAVTFSQRELDVLRHLGMRCENKSIARALSISPETVRFHLKNVYDKLGIQDRELVAEIARERSRIESGLAQCS